MVFMDGMGWLLRGCKGDGCAITAARFRLLRGCTYSTFPTLTRHLNGWNSDSLSFLPSARAALLAQQRHSRGLSAVDTHRPSAFSKVIYGKR